MISYGWDEEDLDELVLDLDKLDPGKLADDELLRMAKTIMRYTREYPGPKPGSKYVRTRRLFRSWGIKVISPLEVMIFNTAMDPLSGDFYAHPVSGENQAEMHKETGWRNIYSSASSWMKVFIERLNRKIDKIWNTDSI